MSQESRRIDFAVLAVLVATGLAVGAISRRARRPVEAPGPGRPTGHLGAVGPRHISNQTEYPVMIWGEHLAAGLKLRLKIDPSAGGPVDLPTMLVDEGHLTAVIPAGLRVQPSLSTLEVAAVLVAPDGQYLDGEARLTVSNDAAFPNPYALELLEERAGPHPSVRVAVASPNTDEVAILGGDRPLRLRLGDGPRALARFEDRGGAAWLAVAHRSGDLVLVPESVAFGATSTAAGPSFEPRGTFEPRGRRVLGIGIDLADVAIDGKAGLAYLTSHQRDRVRIVDLASGEVRGELPGGVNPHAIVLGEGGQIAVVANQASEDVSVVDLRTSKEVRLRPGPKTPIIGGHTEKYARFAMGGKAGRGLVYSERLHVAFMSTLGPNIGPNPDRMEVSMNGGVSVIDAVRPRYVRHVSMLEGVPEGLALDDARGLLYVADGARGRVVVFDARRLAESDASARRALLGAFLLPRPARVARIRPETDAATEAVHFGPKALRLDAKGTSLFVLSRFSGEVVELDVTAAPKGKLELERTIPSWFEEEQPSRRRGEIVYDTDLGNSRMTCDTCHPEGATGGVLFSKGRPIRIYRAEPLRAIRESPPYFTPSRLPSIKRTAEDVLARNRFQKPAPTEEEIASLTEFVGAIASVPNPNVVNGELPAELVLPDGTTGSAVRGLAIFERKGGCAAEACHPPPAFTGDQAPKTRGQLHKLGTPVALALRPELQDLDENYGQPPPSLTGVWDTWPLFLSGAGGNEVAADGTIVPEHPFALRWMLENPVWKEHGHGPDLSDTERADLLAYLLTL